MRRRPRGERPAFQRRPRNPFLTSSPALSLCTRSIAAFVESDAECAVALATSGPAAAALGGARVMRGPEWSAAVACDALWGRLSIPDAAAAEERVRDYACGGLCFAGPAAGAAEGLAAARPGAPRRTPGPRADRNTSRRQLHAARALPSCPTHHTLP